MTMGKTHTDDIKNYNVFVTLDDDKTIEVRINLRGQDPWQYAKRQPGAFKNHLRNAGYKFNKAEVKRYEW